MKIREEQDRDHIAVRAVVEAAFGQPSEAVLVDALRREGAAEISLVACHGVDVVGHIMLSKMAAPPRALGLGPLSVLPGHQGMAVGSSLVRDSLSRAKSRGWEAVFVLGDPAYYGRFGFRADAAKGFASPYAGPYFMVLELVEGALQGKSGKVAYASAFAKLG